MTENETMDDPATATARGWRSSWMKKIPRLPAILSKRLKLERSYLRYPIDQPVIAQATVDGSKLLVFANEDIGREILCWKEYEPSDSAFFSRQIRPEDHCLDIGANTGFYTMMMARRAIEGHVHAFEPVPLNYHLLSAGVLLNDYRNVSINNLLLGSRSGEVDFSVSSDGAFSSLISTGRKPEHRKIKAEMITLDAYAAQNGAQRADVFKMDVEGAEMEVLKGAVDLFGDPKRRPRFAMIELLDVNLRPFGTTVSEVVDFLASFGYEPYGIDKETRKPFTFGESHHNACPNVFFARDPGDLVRDEAG